MSTQINQDVIKSREVVAGYKELNKGTKEVLSTYDPILRLRVFKKETIDPRSKEFTKLYGKKEKKDKPVKVVKFVAPTIDKTKKKKDVKKVVFKPKKVAKPRYVKVEVDKRKEKVFNPDSVASKVYSLYEKKKPVKEICAELNLQVHQVNQAIRNRKTQLGIEVERRRIYKTEDFLEQYFLGKSYSDVKSLFKCKIDTIYFHVKKIKADRTPEMIELEKQHILGICKAKMEDNGSDYFKAPQISSSFNKPKYFLTTPEINIYIDELISEGRILELDNEKERKNKKLSLRN